MNRFELAEVTERAVWQLQDQELMDATVQVLGSAEEVTVGVVEEITVHYSGAETHGQQKQYLTEWHGFVKADCSMLYSYLRKNIPGSFKEEVRTNPDLVVLNNLRRGLRTAMIRRCRKDELNARSGLPRI